MWEFLASVLLTVEPVLVGVQEHQLWAHRLLKQVHCQKFGLDFQDKELRIYRRARRASHN